MQIRNNDVCDLGLEQTSWSLKVAGINAYQLPHNTDRNKCITLIENKPHALLPSGQQLNTNIQKYRASSYSMQNYGDSYTYINSYIP